MEICLSVRKNALWLIKNVCYSFKWQIKMASGPRPIESVAAAEPRETLLPLNLMNITEMIALPTELRRRDRPLTPAYRAVTALCACVWRPTARLYPLNVGYHIKTLGCTVYLSAFESCNCH